MAHAARRVAEHSIPLRFSILFWTVRTLVPIPLVGLDHGFCGPRAIWACLLLKAGPVSSCFAGREPGPSTRVDAATVPTQSAIPLLLDSSTPTPTVHPERITLVPC